MKDKQMSFPQYRKYANDRTYFKINSEDAFEELNIFGKYFTISAFNANILPDKNLLQDMLHKYEETWEKIEEQDFIKKLQWCRNNLTMWNEQH